MCIFIIVLVVIIVICDGIIGVSVILLLLSMFSVLFAQLASEVSIMENSWCCATVLIWNFLFGSKCFEIIVFVW